LADYPEMYLTENLNQGFPMHCMECFQLKTN